MSVVSAFLKGIGRVLLAPAILLAVYLVTVLMALPLGLVLRDMIATHLGNSLAAETAVSGVNYPWWQEFSAQATGLGRTFTPSILGFAAVLDSISSVMDRRGQPIVVAGALAAYLLVWMFLAGGAIDRYARHRATRAQGFFAAGGTFFFRFLRLGIIAGLVYWSLFRFVHSWLFGTAYEWTTRDLWVERTTLGVRAGLYLIFGSVLVFCNLVFDYAKVRAVVEDRRSMIGALVAATRFVARRPGATCGLYLLNGLVFLSIVGAYALVAPGAAGSGLTMWLAFAVTQAYILARLASKLLFYAAQTAYFQEELAHTGYLAAPAPAWPESPAAEAIGAPPT